MLSQTAEAAKQNPLKSLQRFTRYPVQKQCYGSGSPPPPPPPSISSESCFGSGLKGLLTRNWEKRQLKKSRYPRGIHRALLAFLTFKGRPSYRRSLQSSKENKKINLLTVLFLWVIFALLDPDPDPGIQ